MPPIDDHEKYNKRENEPEMVELEAKLDASAAKWGYLALIVLILSITAYKMLKLYYEHN